MKWQQEHEEGRIVIQTTQETWPILLSNSSSLGWAACKLYYWLGEAHVTLGETMYA